MLNLSNLHVHVVLNLPDFDCRLRHNLSAQSSLPLLGIYADSETINSSEQSATDKEPNVFLYCGCSTDRLRANFDFCSCAANEEDSNRLSKVNEGLNNDCTQLNTNQCFRWRNVSGSKHPTLPRLLSLRVQYNQSI